MNRFLFFPLPDDQASMQCRGCRRTKGSRCYLCPNKCFCPRAQPG